MFFLMVESWITYVPFSQSYITIWSSSLLEIRVSPVGEKSMLLIRSVFSLKTFATLKLRTTGSVSFISPLMCIQFYIKDRKNCSQRGRKIRNESLFWRWLIVGCNLQVSKLLFTVALMHSSVMHGLHWLVNLVEQVKFHCFTMIFTK